MISVRLLLTTLIPGAVLVHSVPTLAETAEERLESLDQKVRVLERKLELADEEASTKAKQSAVVGASDKGFSIKSADGENELRFRGYAQVDSRSFLGDDDNRLVNTFLVRKARPIFEGTVAKYIDFRIMPEFAGSATTLFDAYVDLKYLPAANLRVGKFKPPVSLIRLQSDTDALFTERATVTSLTTDRDIGIQVGGPLFGNTVSYAVGVFNGTADNTSSITDAADRKDVAARLFFQPWYNSPGALQGLGFGVAGTTGHQEGAADVAPLRSPGQANIFTYRGTVVANGNHRRVVPQLSYYKDNVGLLAEYTGSTQEVRVGTAAASLEHTGWDVEVNWVITGEDASYKGVKPATAFTPGKEGWGALELGLRYGELDIDNAAFGTYADPAASVTSATTGGIVANWYLNRNLKLSLDYNQTEFKRGAAGGANRPTEQAVIARLQVAY